MTVADIVERLLYQAETNGLATPSYTDALFREAADEITRLRAELDKWEKLRDPSVLHINLLRGELTLTKEQILHLLGDRATPEITDADVEAAARASYARRMEEYKNSVPAREGLRTLSWEELPGFQKDGEKAYARAALRASLSHREKGE